MAVTNSVQSILVVPSRGSSFASETSQVGAVILAKFELRLEQ